MKQEVAEKVGSKGIYKKYKTHREIWSYTNKISVLKIVLSTWFFHTKVDRKLNTHVYFERKLTGVGNNHVSRAPFATKIDVIINFSFPKLALFGHPSSQTRSHSILIDDRADKYTLRRKWWKRWDRKEFTKHTRTIEKSGVTQTRFRS